MQSLSNSFHPQKTVELLFKEGVFVNFSVMENPMGQGYHLSFRKQSGEEVVLTTFRGASSGQPRVFKTIDAAVNVAKEIGFQGKQVAGR